MARRTPSSPPDPARRVPSTDLATSLRSDEKGGERPASDPRGEATREALLEAGLQLFAKLGYHAASSRALAEAAGVNQALIGYHFGGKEGLYLAVFERIGESVIARLGPAAEGLKELLAEDAGATDRERLLAGLLRLIDQAIELYTSPETAPWAMLIVREQQNPSPAFDIVWNHFMSRLSGALCGLVGAIRGEPADSEQNRLMVITVLSQVLMFRVARETVLRLLGWDEIGEPQVEAIRRRLHLNLRSMLIEEIRA
ncbi:MAG: CerR family C-terminal domain-containing protein [Holophagales bacterium]|nr:CerR family C-terminal domain-containing protein [Holophagales bacterium]